MSAVGLGFRLGSLTVQVAWSVQVYGPRSCHCHCPSHCHSHRDSGVHCDRSSTFESNSLLLSLSLSLSLSDRLPPVLPLSLSLARSRPFLSLKAEAIREHSPGLRAPNLPIRVLLPVSPSKYFAKLEIASFRVIENRLFERDLENPRNETSKKARRGHGEVNSAGDRPRGPAATAGLAATRTAQGARAGRKSVAGVCWWARCNRRLRRERERQRPGGGEARGR